MDSGDVFSVYKYIMKGVSEVFNIMFFSDCYLELIQLVIVIHEVFVDVFQFLLYFIYGCISLFDFVEVLLYFLYNCNKLYSI